MLNDELYEEIEKLKQNLEIDKNNFDKSRKLEYIVLGGAVGCLFLGDLDFFIDNNSYASIALVNDFVLGTCMYNVGINLLNKSNKKDLKLIKEKLIYLDSLKEELDNGINRFEQIPKEDFIDDFNSSFNKKQKLKIKK